mmetsp:Transcript_11011/g.15280  ORF Transcript_11011/g.15280 Transcript_11011/m.15280 type:complete len:260 (-) Transcript_11011:747-1526(-)|eukprot:CAMPEP_0185730668 /NCGR_PEP_ID=MMETSP1171-20130828/10645_1 /TAXON_ID=374046 /ORGANISM="Helicotheca tamensis, Strain CCMP826" /LENGTH=259 /DNA_ID=CAMNT_0028399771 /DNA_START=17 /DNA_END=796 /DNA_ORIENTATION=+
MFDMQTFILIGAGTYLIGRKDLPAVSRMVGTQLGRIVGLLQGARARADRFTADSELKKLQNELRAGLRELDAAKAEFAVAASSGVVGRELGSTVAGVRRTAVVPKVAIAASGGGLGTGQAMATVPTSSNTPTFGNVDYLAAAREAADQLPSGQGPLPSPVELAPRTQSVAAVVEDEWEKRGIGFKSRAEMMGHEHTPEGIVGGSSGSVILADLIRETLIHDQYDRVVREQEEMLRSRANKVQRDRQKGSDDTHSGGKNQ